MTLKNLAMVALAASLTVGAAAQTRSSAPEPQDQNIVTAEAPQQSPPRNSNARQVEFLLEALRASVADVRMGELATQQGQDQRIRDYGAKLKSDFAAHATEIERLLEPLGVTIPTEPSAEGLTRLATLTRLSGEEFDMAFVQQMIWTHTDAIESYGAQTHANPDRSVHDFAAASLPMLREHLAKAEALR